MQFSGKESEGVFPVVFMQVTHQTQGWESGEKFER